MDENSLRNTYTFKIKLGITDLMGVTNEQGEFVGCSIVSNQEEYFRRHEYYDNLIRAKNEEYIKLLLERNEYGKEVECDLSLIHNPLFDGPSEPKSIEEFHPSESYRMVFLDLTETPEEDKKLQQEASDRFENTEITYYEFPDERSGKVFRSNSIKHFIDQIVSANNEDQYVRWYLENWTIKDWEKYKVTKYLICGSPGEMTPEVQNKILQTFKQNNMTTDEQIKHVKELRVSIDKNIQDVKEFQDVKKEKGHREIALVITKLQEAKMWLGQVLAEIGATTPYPHADNPANSIVSPTADTYKAKAAIGEKPKYPFVSVHFTIKDQSFESLRILLNKLVTTWEPTFVFTNNEIGTVVVHCFLPKEVVKEKGYSMDLYDQLLDPFFPKQQCIFREGDIQRSRENLLSRVKEENGYAIFIGDVKEGVQEEWDLAKELGVKILHLPHIAES